MNNQIIHKRDTVYYTRIFPTLGIYDLEELQIRTVTDDYFVGTEKRTKKAYLFSYDLIDKTVFINRKEAVDKIKEAEKNKVEVSTETYYEEY